MLKIWTFCDGFPILCDSVGNRDQRMNQTIPVIFNDAVSHLGIFRTLEGTRCPGYSEYREHTDMNFKELGLSKPLVCAVAAEGYTTPTPIQSQAIPEALLGKDVLGCAQTGTGKTCAFALPILQRLSEGTAHFEQGSDQNHDQEQGSGRRRGRGKRGRKRGNGRAPRALVLCPTRELATQIYDSFNVYGSHLPLKHTVVYGGVSQMRQVRAMQAGIDVLVATPGRLLDLINQGHIDLSKIEVLVLDEADRMLDMGFILDIQKVVKMVPTSRQTLFFSATVSKEIRKLANSILRKPVYLETEPESTTVELVAQRVYMVERKNKLLLLEQLLDKDDVNRALIFTRTKHGAEKLAKMLNRSDIPAEAIHGNKTQNARTRTMQRFKSGRTPVLVATDVASRGIDVDEITHVVNYDMPIDPETYVHRIGRTARAGASGIALSFCDRDEMRILRDIERRTHIPLEVAEDIPELTFDAPAELPRERSKGRNQRGRRSGKSNGSGGGWKARSNSRDGDRTKSNRRPRKSKSNNGSTNPESSKRSEKPKSKKRTGKTYASSGGWNPKPNARSGSKRSRS